VDTPNGLCWSILALLLTLTGLALYAWRQLVDHAVEIKRLVERDAQLTEAVKDLQVRLLELVTGKVKGS
jgi:hypothetical protein